MTISGGGSRATGMTIAEALQILEGSPTQEELFGALVTLAQASPVQYEPALDRAAEILTAQSRTEVTADQVQSVVDQLLGATETQPDDLTAGVGAPPPPPPEEADLPQAAQRSPIGVAPDFRTVRTERAAQTNILRPIDRLAEPARYRAGDEDQFMSKSGTEIRRLQRELERAGLLLPGGYTPGFWDQATSQAMFSAMGFANQRGSTWDAVVRELQSLPRQVDVEEFVPPPELKPDPAAIEQSVKSAFRNRLGREPTEAELAEFGGHLTSSYGTAYDQQVAMARAAFEAGQEPDAVSSGRAFQSDIGGRSLAAATAPSEPGSFVDVDPVARFQQLFDQRFGPELGFIDRREDTQTITGNVATALSTMSGMMG